MLQPDMNAHAEMLNKMFLTTMVLNETELTEAIEKIKQHVPDYYSDNDNSLIVSPKLGPTRNGHVEIIQRVNAVIRSEPVSARTLKLLAIRADLYIKIGKYRLALADTTEILKADTSQLAVVESKAEALIGLHMFETAKDFLNSYVSLLPSNASLKAIYLKCCMFSIQYHNADYPWKDIATRYRAAPEKFVGLLDWVDYEGPEVTIKETTDGKGRGIFAIRNISAGQLILGTKAFAVFIKGSRTKKTVRALDGRDDEVEEEDSLTKLMIRMLRQNPNTCKQVYRLYPGPKYRGINPPPLQLEQLLTDDQYDFLDEKRIEEICAFNTYAFGDFSGVWGLPSYMNHSCYDCNSGWLMYGDFLFIRAFKDIKEGEEITTSYVSLDTTYAHRWKALATYGIACGCTLCKFDRKESPKIIEEKEELLNKLQHLKTEEIESKIVFSETSVGIAARIIDRLLEIRPVYNMFLHPYLAKIYWYYYYKGDFEKAFQYAVASYNAIKNAALLVVEAYEICNTIVEILLLANDFEQAKKWYDILKNAEILAFGRVENMGHASLEDWNAELEPKRAAILLNGVGTARSSPEKDENGNSTEKENSSKPNENGFHTEE